MSAAFDKDWVTRPDDVFHHPSNWREVSRADALTCHRQGPVVVVFRSRVHEHAEWFDSSHPFARGVAPHSLNSLRYYRRERPRLLESRRGGGASAAAAPPLPQQAPPVSAVRVRKTWVEVKLLTDKGKPVANAKYSIRLPDGSTRRGSLDAEGSVRFDEIDPGSCEVSFPEIDVKEWGPQ